MVFRKALDQARCAVTARSLRPARDGGAGLALIVDTAAGRADLPLIVGDAGVGVVEDSVEGDEGADHGRAGGDPGDPLAVAAFCHVLPLADVGMTMTLTQ